MPEKPKNFLEYREYPVSLIMERRSDDNAERIVGHAAVFNSVGDGGWFREQIAPGAFKRSIQEDDVRALFNHDPNFVLGRNRAGTLTMKEDERGLWVEIDPPDTEWARGLKVSITRGDISQMSFGFEILEESRQKGDGKEPDLFTIMDVRLWDVSPVTFPFYKETDVTVHSRKAWSESETSRVKTIPPGMRLNLIKKEFNLKHY